MSDTFDARVVFSQTVGTLFGGCWVMRGRMTMFVGLWGVALSVLWLFAYRGTDDSNTMGIAVLAFWLSYALGFFVLPVVRLKAFLREPNLAGECLIAVSEDGLVGRNGNMETRYQWKSFSRFVETSHLLFLQIGRKHFITIPKAAFDDQDELTRFTDILSRNLAKRAGAAPRSE